MRKSRYGLLLQKMRIIKMQLPIITLVEQTDIDNKLTEMEDIIDTLPISDEHKDNILNTIQQLENDIYDVEYVEVENDYLDQLAADSA